MDLSYLTEGIEHSDKQVLTNISTLSKKLVQLKQDMLLAEEAYENAKKAYEHFANVLLPQEMFSCGLDSIKLDTGETVEVIHNFYCQPNKNAQDRQVIADFLKKYNGEHLIEHNVNVAEADTQLLKENNIPFTDSVTINTARLKAFLKAGIGESNGTQLFNIDDIPKCAHFQEVTTVQIKD